MNKVYRRAYFVMVKVCFLFYIILNDFFCLLLFQAFNLDDTDGFFGFKLILFYALAVFF